MYILDVLVLFFSSNYLLKLKENFISCFSFIREKMYISRPTRVRDINIYRQKTPLIYLDKSSLNTEFLMFYELCFSMKYLQ
jgi:hypothetical protein